MTTALSGHSADTIGQSETRVVSIDVFRGLTMVVMIFVNDLASVHGLPWWTYHMPADIDAMTYVDMVFPCFLFIVGMSIPLAVRQRVKGDGGQMTLWLHVFLRAFSLLVLGLILANAEQVDASRTRLNPNLWTLLALVGAVLLWGVFGPLHGHKRALRFLRVAGFALLITLFAVFRRSTQSGHVAWISTTYPEILGLIAFTYLAVCALYIPTRRWLWAPLAWFTILVAFNALCAAKLITFPNHLSLFAWPVGNGAMASISMAGVVTSSIFLGAHPWNTSRSKTWIALTFAIVILATGWFLTPLGISKIRATPTWSLYSVGASVLLFSAMYWICDVKQLTSWANFARPAGSNTLLTYLLPDFYYYLVGLLSLSYPAYLNAGLPGVLRAIVFTLAILGLAGLLTKWKISMRL
jgi:heparan-alpha-glucosaminide N-acetyltransferase